MDSNDLHCDEASCQPEPHAPTKPLSSMHVSEALASDLSKHEETSVGATTNMTLAESCESMSADGTSAEIPRQDCSQILSTEIWDMVFEHLPAETYKNLRMVCQKFNKSALPLVYQRILLRYPDDIAAAVRQDILDYCKEITVHTEMNWEKTAELLAGCKVLTDLKWSYFPDDPCKLPAEVQDVLQKKLRHVKIHLIIGNWCNTEREARRTAFCTSTLESLASLDIRQPIRDLEGTEGQDIMDDFFDRLLTSSRRLKDLTSVEAPSFRVRSQRMAPLLRLQLRGPWNYSRSEVLRIWDFSKLQTLSLFEANIGIFEEHVTADMFPVLKHLEVLQKAGFQIPGSPPADSRGLANFVGKLPGLTSIGILCQDLSTLAGSIKRHGKSLQVLNLTTQTHRLSGEAHRGMEFADLETILSSCIALTGFTMEYKLPVGMIPEDHILSLTRLMGYSPRLQYAEVDGYGNSVESPWDPDIKHWAQDCFRQSLSRFYASVNWHGPCFEASGLSRIFVGLDLEQ